MKKCDNSGKIVIVNKFGLMIRRGLGIVNSLELLTQLEERLTANRQVEHYCKDSLQWVRERKADWETDFVRLGIIGVTSSGKSTLVNAIVGADILSKAVVPTSGQLVYCSYGQEEMVTIKFEDGTSRILTGSEFNKDNVTEYADARYNPDNKKKVLGIEIVSPRYALDKDVLLIDSPGLDAYGLESHEKLTLETMVPTIDVCIYVTTMKANNDVKTEAVLNILAKHGCPVIVVQNMLDTVKASVDGTISRKQAAADHLARIREIISRSDIQNNMVSVVQMSAEYARQCRLAQLAGTQAEVIKYEEKYKESHYEEFINYVNSTLKKERPRIEQTRRESVFACVDTIQQRVAACMAGKGGDSEAEFEYGELKKRLKDFEEYQLKEYERVTDRYMNAVSNIRKGLSKTEELDISLDKTNAQVKELGNGMLAIIEKGNELIEQAAKEVNIPSRDLMKSMVFQPVDAIAVKKRVIKSEKKRKDLGWGAVLKRGMGYITGNADMGYHTEYNKRYETDEEGTKQLIEQQLDVAFARYSAMYKEWKDKSFYVAVGTINKVVDLAEELHDIRKESVVQDMGLRMLEGDIAELIEEWSEQEEILPIDEEKQDIVLDTDEEDVHMEGYETHFKQTAQVDVSGTMASVIRLSKNMGRNIHNSVAKSLFKRVNCMEHTPVIVGWDNNCIKEFIWQVGIKDAIVCNGDMSQESVTKESKRCFFILANTIQFGAAKKQILEAQLAEVIRSDDYIVWVVQDFAELLTGDNLVEGLQSMLTFVKEQSQLCDGCIWLSHDNPIYNLIFLEHQMEPIVTKEKEQEIFRVCNSKYASYMDGQVVGNIIRIIKDVKID